MFEGTQSRLASYLVKFACELGPAPMAERSVAYYCRRSLCPEKLGSNPGQGSKGINFSGWHGLDRYVHYCDKETLNSNNKQTCELGQIMTRYDFLCARLVILSNV